MELLHGEVARSTNSASKAAPKYTASRHATTSSATPTHFSTSDSTPSVVLASSSSYLVACRIASYKAAYVPPDVAGRGSVSAAIRPVTPTWRPLVRPVDVL